MLRADRAVPGAHDPTLHEREDQVRAGQRLVCGSPRGADRGGSERVMPTGGLRVGRPTVGDDGAAWLDVIEQELLQAAGAGVLEDAQTCAAKTPGVVEFYGYSEQHLAQRSAPWDACFRAAEEGLVDLNIARKSVPSRPLHDRSVAMQHRPGGLVGPELNLTLQLGGRDAALPAGQVPGGCGRRQLRQLLRRRRVPGRSGLARSDRPRVASPAPSQWARRQPRRHGRSQLSGQRPAAPSQRRRCCRRGGVGTRRAAGHG